jgi:hypothetical protein
MALTALATGSLTVVLGLLLLLVRPARQQRGPAPTRPAASALRSPRPQLGPGVAPAPPSAVQALAAPAPQHSGLEEQAAPAPQAASRPRPPRFRRQPAPPALKVVDFPALATAQPMVGMAIGRTARSTRDEDIPKLMKCATGLAARRPSAVVDGELLGSVALIMQVEAGQMRLVGVEPHKDSDARYAECFGQALGWAGQVMDAAGAPDGKFAVEWPYSLTVEK